jgi:hypothetical protein
MNDAELMDVYADSSGKLWRVVGICGEPTIIVQEIESLSPESPVQRHGGISGAMWFGFKRVFRPEKPTNKMYAEAASSDWMKP